MALGKDTELRQAIGQQQQAIDAAKQQADSLAGMQLHKSEAFLVVLAVMAIMLFFRK